MVMQGILEFGQLNKLVWFCGIEPKMPQSNREASVLNIVIVAGVYGNFDGLVCRKILRKEEIYV